MLKKLSAIIVVIVGVVILYSFNMDKESSSTPPPPFHYETIVAPKGEYILHIPVNTYFGLEHIEKKVKFNKEFLIGKHEVSNKLWNLCFKNKGCSKQAIIEENESENHPVVRVNWHDAFMFSKWLSKETGYKYRLPTEEEWVYATYLGKEHKEIEVEYDYSDLEKIRKISKRTKPIGSFPTNSWGFSDYHGNVWEWTLTCWFASEENMLKKFSIKELNSPEACTTRIAQGENRSHVPDFISDTYNGGCATLRPAANLGFRLVRED